MTLENKPVRVRFAPSPTGYFHIGSARTALYSWLFARANDGKFILRIEDTDKERSKPEFETDILNGLKWLGLDWDEFYKQSEREDIYKEHLLKLLNDKKAYYCFCSKEDLEAEKNSRAADGLPSKYSGRCRSISPEEARDKIVNGDPAVIRLVVPEKTVEFNDIIRGKIKFETNLFGDFVIAKNVNSPLFNFAVVVDDALMEITHVIRGEDHISNTPRQILIYDALGFSEPKFAHIPLILNPDRSKMSKRFVNTALRDYIEEGYLPDALVNFLALLGWHPVADKETMSREELIEEFTLERVQKGGAIFAVTKLDWLNSHYINELNHEDFNSLASKFMPEEWVLNKHMIDSVRGRLRKMSEVKDLTAFYFELPDYTPELLKWKDMEFDKVKTNLGFVLQILDNLDEDSFNKERLEKILIEKTSELPKGEVFWPLRVALSGQDKSPTPFEIMGALGKEETLRRVKLAIEKSTN